MQYMVIRLRDSGVSPSGLHFMRVLFGHVLHSMSSYDLCEGTVGHHLQVFDFYINDPLPYTRMDTALLESLRHDEKRDIMYKVYKWLELTRKSVVETPLTCEWYTTEDFIGVRYV